MARALTILVVTLSAVISFAQQPDPKLAEYIDSVPAIDNHAHVVVPDLEHDKGYDALPCSALPSTTALAPANMRFGPDVLAAWKALYGFTGKSEKDAESKEFKERVAAVRKEHATDFPEYVLQQSGIEVVLANRIEMAPQLSKEHFFWVPYDDALLFPLDNSQLKSANPDRNVLFGLEESLFKTYLADSGLSSLPASLDEYVSKVLAATLDRQKKGSAVALKLEVAYLRSLDFGPADHEAAASVYARFAKGGSPSGADYKVLQDYLFHQFALNAARLELPIQIHTGLGCGEFFNDAGADPMLLSAVLNDPSLRKTKFVLLHGGTPFNRHIVSLLLKPNVYADTSILELVFSPEEYARILRPWLEVMPEHILFGTDAGPIGTGEGWEESTWIGSRNARRGLALVLSDMMRDGLISRERAENIAKGVLFQNAGDLYFSWH